MSELDTRDPLEALLGSALREDAERAPSLPDQWIGSGLVELSPSEPRTSRRGGGLAGAELAAGGPNPGGRRWALLLTVAAAVILFVAGIVALRDRQGAPAVSSASSGSVQAAITWYEPEEADVSIWATSVVCRSLREDGGCDALAGSRTVTFRTRNGQIDVITEFGPDESDWWQTLVQTGREADLGGRLGLVIASNPELVGFSVSPNTRVVVVGEARTDPAGIAATLTTRTEFIDAPVVFGEAIPSDEEMPRDGVAARYYAGYLDTISEPACVGGIGVPWNNEPSCIPVEPDTLTVTVATPSPAGTVLIATVPLHTSTAVATVDDESPRDLTITDASDAGYKLVFADLDGSIPLELIAYDSEGRELARIDIVSTGGANLGYLPVDGLAG